MTVRLPNGKVLNGTEITFLGEDEACYPQLLRLNLDFDFRVLAIENFKEGGKQYMVTYKSGGASEATPVTPLLGSLSDLEDYTNEHIIEILHDTLFEANEEE